MGDELLYTSTDLHKAFNKGLASAIHVLEDSEYLDSDDIQEIADLMKRLIPKTMNETP